jgi:hypothetical protein
MRRKRHQTIVLFISSLMILALSLGNSFGGIFACSPDCSKCRVVPSCCAGIEGNDITGTEGSAKPVSGPNDCDHGGICIDGLPPTSTSAVNNGFQDDQFPSPSPQGSSIKPVYHNRVSIPIIQEPSSEKFPPLFLRNCSFLI